MIEYDYNGEQKHNMLIAHLTHHHYIINIVYEDFEGSAERLLLSTNIRDFFDEEKRIQQIKDIFQNQLTEYFKKEYMDVKWKIPKYIQNLIIARVQII